MENLMVFQMVAYLVGMMGKHWAEKMAFQLVAWSGDRKGRTTAEQKAA